VDSLFNRIAAGYKTVLSFALKHAVLVIIVSLVIFAVSLGILTLLRKEFVPPQDQSMFMCSLQTPPGSSLQFTDERVREVEAFVKSRPETLRFFVAVGGFSGGDVTGANMFVTLKPPKDRPLVKGRRLSQKDLMDIFRKELNKIKGIKTRIQDLSLSGFSSQRGFPIEFSIRGPEWDKLVEYEAILESKMEKSGMMVDVDSDYKPGASEIQVIPDRLKAQARGVSMDAIGEAVNVMIGGSAVAKYSSGASRYDVRVRLDAGQRVKPEDIDNIFVANNRGERVPLKEVITITQKATAQSITRRGRERAISMFANVAPGKAQADAINAAEKITRETLPEPYRAVLGGSAQTFKDSSSGIGIVFLLGIIVAYMVLGSQYNSFLHPFIVLLALPFSISGAFMGLLIGGQSLNLYSMIGLILLMGIVKKNSIMLVDFTNQVRAEGKGVHEALETACPIRLRPILMTSLATIAAAIPPALAIGPGAEVRIPMSVTVIGGVIVSTFFTLFVVPCVYRLTVRDAR
ncbi:MAG: efflux RND transporter permease subunit, partial [Candidatus Omnitrophota bacterium]